LEDTITFHLIERAQFPLNATVYVAGGIPIPNSQLSLFEWILREQERLHSLVRRYQAPDEYAFFPDALEKPILTELQYPAILHENDVNVNQQIKEGYIKNILPMVCQSRKERSEQQENYGSSATVDVLVVQSMSRRIHIGKLVAESKFQAETERFVKLIKAEDRKGIDEAITNAKVENQILDRLRLKAKTYGTDPEGAMGKIDVEAVVGVYRDVIIPLTKIVEVEYLMQRLKGTQWE
jgi:chorismate mutase